MKNRNFKFRFVALFSAAMMLFASSSVAFASEADAQHEFGDVLYSDNGITVFYGNPYENEEAAEAAEAKATRSLKYTQQWVDANTSSDKRIIISASSSNPLTYYTIKQETTSPLRRSYVYVYRPDGSVGFIWQMNSGNQEIKDRVIGTRVLPNKAYAWTSGYLQLRWDVETGSSGARMNLWAW